MKKIITSLLLFIIVLAGCSSKNETYDVTMIAEGLASIELKNDVNVDVTALHTTTRYGGYEVEGDSSRILVVDTKITNNSSTEFITGNSQIKGISNDMELEVPTISTFDDYIGMSLTVAPGESVSTQLAYAISPAVNEEIILAFTDFFFVEDYGKMTINIANVEEKLPEKAEESKVTGDFDQSKTYAGATIEVGELKAVSAEELQKKNPGILGLQKGSTYLLIDTLITNNSEHTLGDFSFSLQDDMGNSSFSSGQSKYVENGYTAYQDVIEPGETSGGTLVYAVDDRVTSGQLTINLFYNIDTLNQKKIIFDLKVAK